MLYFARWKVGLIVLSVILAFLFVMPNFFSKEEVASWPNFLPKRQVVLGLDLRGGAHLLWKVDRKKRIEARRKTLVGDIRQRLRDARIGASGVRIEGMTARFTLNDEADVEKARTALEDLTNPVQAGLFGQGSVREITMSVNGPVFELTW